jgi:hypothetical protein
LGAGLGGLTEASVQAALLVVLVSLGNV